MPDRDKAPDGWESPQKILVILAHPDDPEFFCGATIARWVRAGHHVMYCILTCGDKGSKDLSVESDELCLIRQKEQCAAAKVLGVDQVRFLNYPDGYLVPDINLRRDITRVIREVRPEVLVTCDPQTLFTTNGGLNHPDHRAAGQATLDAVFPAARDHLTFPELWKNEKLGPHIVREVWVSGTLMPDIILDVTETWEIKIQSLYEHQSQIGDREKLTERMRNRYTEDSTKEKPRYEEKFRRLIIG
jgi:LmbE family N-acetylglucosaminyl deacetylase